MFLKLTLFLCLFVNTAFGQYEDYESYQTFSDLDQYQRDYGLILAPSFIYTTISENNSAPGQTVNNRARDLFFYDLKLGYIFRSGFYFGILYAGESQDINSSTPKTARESVGLSFGYVRWGWSLTGSFFPYSRQSVTGDTDVSEYTKGMGFQLDLAYYFRLGRYLSIGPQLIYKNIDYKKAEAATGSTVFDASSNHSVLTPMVTLLFNLYRG